MKKLLTISMFVLAGSAIGADKASDPTGKGDVWGHSYFSVRPYFRTAMPEKETMFRDRALVCDDNWGGAFQAVVFGGRSTQSKQLGRFFSPCPKDELVVIQTQNIFSSDGKQRDVNGRHFNIDYRTEGATGKFQSTIKFRPQHSFIGVGLDYKMYIGGCDCDKSWWFQASAPVVHVRNKMKLTEVVDTGETSGTAQTDTNENMIEAFKGQKAQSG